MRLLLVVGEMRTRDKEGKKKEEKVKKEKNEKIIIFNLKNYISNDKKKLWHGAEVVCAP